MLRSIFCFALLITMSLSLKAQIDKKTIEKDTSYWVKGMRFSVNFNQSTLSNWSAGGASSVSGASYLSIVFDHKKRKFLWQNSLELGYGLIKEDGQASRKSEDKIIYISNYGRKIADSKWYFSSYFDFRTQFTRGYDGEDFSNYISNFLAPAYILSSIGFDWIPNSSFKISASPFSGKFTIVNDDSLSAIGAYGVLPGEFIRSELGGNMKVNFQKEIFKNGKLISSLILFSNYKDNPDKIDVNLENNLVMKINNLLSANIYNQLIYDYDIKFEVFDENGLVLHEESKVQFKNILGLGLTYSLGGSRN